MRETSRAWTPIAMACDVLKAERVIVRILPANLFETELGAGGWWVVYVRSRQEKILASYLQMRGVSHYLPQREQRTRVDGRTRLSYVPLFSGYLFLHGTAADRVVALTSNVIVSFLEVRDQAGLHDELANLFHLERTGAPLDAHPYLEEHAPVEVVTGPFSGARGTVLRYKGGAKLVVSISLLQRSVAVELPIEALAAG